MIYIRKSVFETNSSSSHSIVLLKNDKPAEDIVDGEWYVQDGEIDFWWENDLSFDRAPFDLLTDWYHRLCYAIASYGRDQDKIRDIEEICRRRISGFERFKFKKDKWENNEYYGYIDHESVGLLDAALGKYSASLEDFIFNDKFIVVIDGDEYCVFNTLIDTDLFNKDKVEDITSASYELERGDWREEGEK